VVYEDVEVDVEADVEVVYEDVEMVYYVLL
jgi:hypothetical protein